jgi:hypothetical protein
MRKLINLTAMGVVAMGLGIGLSGCSEEASTKSQTTTQGPGGKTTVTDEKKVTTSGDNPPAPGKTP